MLLLHMSRRPTAPLQGLSSTAGKSCVGIYSVRVLLLTALIGTQRFVGCSLCAVTPRCASRVVFTVGRWTYKIVTRCFFVRGSAHAALAQFPHSEHHFRGRSAHYPSQTSKRGLLPILFSGQCIDGRPTHGSSSSTSSSSSSGSSGSSSGA